MIPTFVLFGFLIVIVVLYGLMVAFGNQTSYLAGAMIMVLAIFLIFFYHAKVQTLVDQNPSRFLPDESKRFKGVSRGMYLVQLLWFLSAIKLSKVEMRALWLGTLAILVAAWSWYQWRRLNQRLHIQK